MLCQLVVVEHPATQRDQSQVMYDRKLEAKIRAYSPVKNIATPGGH